MKRILVIFSLLMSCQTFAQNAMSLTEYMNLEIQMMPFQVRLRNAPYTIQTVSKNKPITIEGLKEYLVAGSNLKFIAQDQPGNPVSNSSDARIIISEDGKSVKIRPKDYTANTTPATPIELYHTFASVFERNTGYLYKTYPLYEKTEAFPISTNNVIVLSNFRELYQISGFYRYTDANANEHTINLNEVSTDPKIAIDLASKTVTMLPFDCGTCTNKQYQINLKYTKP